MLLQDGLSIRLQKLVILKDTYEKEDLVAMKLLPYGHKKRCSKITCFNSKSQP